MKKLIAGFVLGVLSVVLLGAAGGNGDIEAQLKLPEAQQALGDYIQRHCISDVSAFEAMKAIDRVKAVSVNDGSIIFIHTYCWSDTPSQKQ